MEQQTNLKNGPAAAAFLAVGNGALALGMITTLAETDATVSRALTVYGPAGALSGEILVEVLVWVVAWIVLRWRWKDKQVDLDSVLRATIILIALGVLGTFPIFFNAIAGK